MPEELSVRELRLVIYKMAPVDFESSCAGRRKETMPFLKLLASIVD